MSEIQGTCKFGAVAGLIVESGITWAILTSILCEVVCVFGLDHCTYIDIGENCVS